MKLHEVAKQITALNNRIGQLERAAANPTQDVIAGRFKRSEAITKGDVYAVSGPQTISGTTTEKDSRAIVAALESSSDSIGSGQAWALCAMAGQAWVNLEGIGGSPAVNDYVTTSTAEGKAAVQSTQTNGAFGRIVRLDLVNARALVFFSKNRGELRQFGLVDAYIDDSNPTTNFNGETNLVARLGGPIVKHMIVRPPSGAPDRDFSSFVYLHFKVLAQSAGSSGIFVNAVERDVPWSALWNESTVTWDRWNADQSQGSLLDAASFTGQPVPFTYRTDNLSVSGSDIWEDGHLIRFRFTGPSTITIASSEHPNPLLRPFYEFTNELKFGTINPT